VGAIEKHLGLATAGARLPRREGHIRQRGVEALKTPHRPSPGSCRALMGGRLGQQCALWGWREKPCPRAVPCRADPMCAKRSGKCEVRGHHALEQLQREAPVREHGAVECLEVERLTLRRAHALA
jgi:hypothetical protein